MKRIYEINKITVKTWTRIADNILNSTETKHLYEHYDREATSSLEIGYVADYDDD